MNNPKVYRSMHFAVPVLMQNTITWYEKNLNDRNRNDLVFSEFAGGGCVAFGGIVSINHEIGKAETYIFVDPDSQHKGIGLKAESLMCDYAFNELGLNKLYAITNEDNYASIRLHEEIGYKLEGRLREEYVTKDGVFKDRLYYGLLKKDWNMRH